MAEDLFDHEPLIWSDQFSQAPEIFRRIRESVRMIDANAVDQSFVDPRLHLPMAEFEDLGGVLLAQRSEFVDGKEPSVVDDPGVPRYESVRLPGVHLLWRSEFSTGSDGEAVLVEREKCFLAIFLDSQCVEIVRAASTGSESLPSAPLAPLSSAQSMSKKCAYSDDCPCVRTSHHQAFSRGLATPTWLGGTRSTIRPIPRDRTARESSTRPRGHQVLRTRLSDR